MARLWGLFTECANVHPQHRAVVFDDGATQVELTYKQIQALAHQICSGLRQWNVKGEVVGLVLKSSVQIPAVILGVLECRAAFYSIEPQVPVGFLHYVIHRLHLRFLLVDSSVENVFLERLDNFCIEKKGTVGARMKIIQILDQPSVRRVPDLAYVITTSGTTGNPKIVQVPHKCIVPNILHLRSLFNITPEDLVFQASPLTFDPSIVEMFVALTSGACLLLVPDVLKLVPKQLAAVLAKRNKVTVIQATPTLIGSLGPVLLKKSLLSDVTSLRILAFGGEACPSTATIKAWRTKGNSTRFYNLYGITEVSSWATIHELTPSHISGEDQEVPLGEPLWETVLAIRDEQGVQSSEGFLYIGGNDRVCIVDNEGSLQAGMMWNSGDWVSQDENGQLWYRGRKDDQTKRMGKRLNLLALEKVATKCAAVEQAVAILKEEQLYLFLKITCSLSAHSGFPRSRDFDVKAVEITELDDSTERLLEEATQDNDNRVIEEATQDIDERVIEDATQDIDDRNIEGATQDIDERVMGGPTQDIDERGIERATQDIDYRVLEMATQDIEDRIIEEATQDIDYRIIERATQDIDDRVMERATQDNNNRRIEEATQDIDDRIMEGATQDIDDRVIVEATQDIDNTDQGCTIITRVIINDGEILPGSITDNATVDQSYCNKSTEHCGSPGAMSRLSGSDQNYCAVVQHVKQQIHSDLPDHYSVDVIDTFSHFPMTTHGKVNKKRLLDLHLRRYKKYFVKGESELGWNQADVGREICSKWQQTLRLPEGIPADVSINFLEAGGSSFSAVNFTETLETLFCCELPMLLELTLTLTLNDVIHYVWNELSGRQELTSGKPRRDVEGNRFVNSISEVDQGMKATISNVTPLIEKPDKCLKLKRKLVNDVSEQQFDNLTVDWNKQETVNYKSGLYPKKTKYANQNLIRRSPDVFTDVSSSLISVFPTDAKKTMSESAECACPSSKSNYNLSIKINSLSGVQQTMAETKQYNRLSSDKLHSAPSVMSETQSVDHKSLDGSIHCACANTLNTPLSKPAAHKTIEGSIHCACAANTQNTLLFDSAVHKPLVGSRHCACPISKLHVKSHLRGDSLSTVQEMRYKRKHCTLLSRDQVNPQCLMSVSSPAAQVKTNQGIQCTSTRYGNKQRSVAKSSTESHPKPDETQCACQDSRSPSLQHSTVTSLASTDPETVWYERNYSRLSCDVSNHSECSMPGDQIVIDKIRRCSCSLLSDCESRCFSVSVCRGCRVCVCTGAMCSHCMWTTLRQLQPNVSCLLSEHRLGSNTDTDTDGGGVEKRRGNHVTRVGLQNCWKFDTGKCVDASPLVVLGSNGKSIIYIGSHSYKFVAVDLRDGSAIWQTDLGDRVESSACLSVCAQFVIVGCYDGFVYTLDSDTGEVKWKYQTAGPVKSSPCLDTRSGLVYVGSHDHHVYALHPAEQRCVWRQYLGGGSVFSSPCISTESQQLYAATLAGSLMALNLVTGATQWSQNLGKPIFSSPASSWRGVGVGCVSGIFYFFSHAGRQLWTYQTDGPIFSSPCVWPSTTCPSLRQTCPSLRQTCPSLRQTSVNMQVIVFGCHDKHLYCLTENGDVLFRTRVDSEIYSIPFVFTRCQRNTLSCQSCKYSTPSRHTYTGCKRQADNEVHQSKNCEIDVLSAPHDVDCKIDISAPHRRDCNMDKVSAPHRCDCNMDKVSAPHQCDCNIDKVFAPHRRDCDMNKVSAPHRCDCNMEKVSAPHNYDCNMDKVSAPHRCDCNMDKVSAPHNYDCNMDKVSDPHRCDCNMDKVSAPHNYDCNMDKVSDPHQCDCNMDKVSDPHNCDCNMDKVSDPHQCDCNMDKVSDPHQCDCNMDKVSTPHRSDCNMDSDTLVGFSSTKGSLYLLRLMDGTILQQRHFPGETFSSPVIIDDQVILGCRDDYVYCLKIIEN